MSDLDDEDGFEDDSDDLSDLDDEDGFEDDSDDYYYGEGSSSHVVPSSVYIPKYVDYPFAYAKSASLASNSYSSASTDDSEDVNQSYDQNDNDNDNDSESNSLLSSSSSKDNNGADEKSGFELSTDVDMNHKAGNPLLILVISLFSLLFVPINRK